LFPEAFIHNLALEVVASSTKNADPKTLLEYVNENVEQIARNTDAMAEVRARHRPSLETSSSPAPLLQQFQPAFNAPTALTRWDQWPPQQHPSFQLQQHPSFQLQQQTTTTLSVTPPLPPQPEPAIFSVSNMQFQQILDFQEAQREFLLKK
jgi:hypothetical protein